MPRKKRSKLDERRCAFCLKWFKPTTPKQIYHSEACRAAAYRSRKADRNLDMQIDEAEHDTAWQAFIAGDRFFL